MRRAKFDLFGGSEPNNGSEPPVKDEKLRATPPKSSVWSCSDCTFDNKITSTKCKMCGKAKTRKKKILLTASSSSSSSSSEEDETDEEDDEDSDDETYVSPPVDNQIKRSKPETTPPPTQSMNILDLDSSPQQFYNKDRSPVFEAPPPVLPALGNYTTDRVPAAGMPRVSNVSSGSTVDLGYVEQLITTPSVQSHSPVSDQTPIVRSRQQYLNSVPSPNTNDSGFQSAFTLSKATNIDPPQVSVPSQVPVQAPVRQVPQPLSFQGGQSVPQHTSDPTAHRLITNTNGFQQRQRGTGDINNNDNNTSNSNSNSRQQHQIITNDNSSNGFQQRQRFATSNSNSGSGVSVQHQHQHQHQHTTITNNSTSNFQQPQVTSTPVSSIRSEDTAQLPSDGVSNGRESIFRSGFTIQKPDLLNMSAAALIGGRGQPPPPLSPAAATTPPTPTATTEALPSALSMGDKKVRKPSAKKAAAKPGGKRTRAKKEYIPGEKLYWTTIGGRRTLHGPKSKIKLTGSKAYAVWKQNQEDIANGVVASPSPAAAPKVRAPRKRAKAKDAVAPALQGGLTDFVAKPKAKRKSRK